MTSADLDQLTSLLDVDQLTGWADHLDELFIGGRWVPTATGRTVDVVSPSTESVVAQVADATTADVDRAVAAARSAFDAGPWPRMTMSERLAVMRRVRDALAERQDIVARIVTTELGAPITQSRQLQATMGVAIGDAYMEVAEEFQFGSVRSAANGSALVTHEPVGVVTAVIPWNGPSAACLLKLFPALLAGCTVVLKPALETPMSAYLIAEVMQEAGLPAGVVNVVPAGADASEYLVCHPGVDKVTFTGSTATGRRVAQLCGARLKRVTLELGGKSAAVILDDADLDAAVAALRMGSLRNSGQICSLKTRILVSRRHESELLERLCAMVETMPVGDPFDPATEIGPMVSARQRDRVLDYVTLGRNEGASPVLGGGGAVPGLERGYYVQPTIFAGVRRDMRIAQEEIFGPVLSVLRYDHESEAIAIANDSEYGLNGAVFGGDLERAFHVARQIRTGTVELNGNGQGFKAPAGGFKASGIGREYGVEGFRAFLEPKSYGVPRSVTTGFGGDLSPYLNERRS